MLNLAPAGAPSEALLGALDYLCVNEHEAATLGRALAIDASEPEGIGAALARRFGFAVIVTLGPAGAVGFIAGERAFAPAPKVAAVDTTAAGDTFVGAFAAARDRGLSFADAMKRGVVAGSLACAKPGAQTSMPTAGRDRRSDPRRLTPSARARHGHPGIRVRDGDDAATFRIAG